MNKTIQLLYLILHFLDLHQKADGVSLNVTTWQYIKQKEVYHTFQNF